MAKCWGVLEGLKLTNSLELRRVELNIDSLIVVKAIEEGNINKIGCLTLIKEI